MPLRMQIIQQAATIVELIGNTQQQAPAQLVATNTLIHDVPESSEWTEVQQLPLKIVKQMQDIEQVIDSLPTLQTEVCLDQCMSTTVNFAGATSECCANAAFCCFRLALHAACCVLCSMLRLVHTKRALVAWLPDYA